jgi:hypothetical protein
MLLTLHVANRGDSVAYSPASCDCAAGKPASRPVQIDLHGVYTPSSRGLHAALVSIQVEATTPL